MFELHVGSTPCELGPKDYRLLAEKTEGFSGSDISVIVRDALMQPIRKVTSATHFKRIPDPKAFENGEGGKESPALKWTPCSPGDPDAVEMSISDIGRGELVEPPLKIADFLKSLTNTRPTVTEKDIKKHEQWTEESGEFFFFFFSL